MTGARRRLALLAAGHACADLCQGAIPALVPFLIADRGLSFTQTGLLALVMSVTSSIVQPLVGLWSDRHGAAWPVPAGVALAGAGVAALGLVGSFWAATVATATAGAGVALFHPGGARAAPVLLTPAVLVAGLPGSAVVLVPTLAVAAALTRLPAPARPPAATVASTSADRPGPFALLTVVASLRAGAYFAALAFLAAALIARLGVSPATANGALTALLVTSAVGTLVGGRLADRVGHRAVIAGSLAATVLALAATLAAPTPALGVAAAALLGLVVGGSYSATVVLGQELLSARPTLAAGTTLGLAIGAGGLVVAALGPLADAAGPATALWAVAGLAAVGALLSLALPRSPAITSAAAPCAGRA